MIESHCSVIFPVNIYFEVDFRYKTKTEEKKHTNKMDQNISLLIICGLFVLVTSLPLKTDDDNVEHLVSLIKKLKSLEKRPETNSRWLNHQLHHLRIDSSPAEKSDSLTSGERDSGILYRSLNSDMDTPSKRQGAWSYDYGLGGGRFGKRSYDDYGIGGGRFGRDVDHVDLADGVLDSA